MNMVAPLLSIESQRQHHIKVIAASRDKLGMIREKSSWYELTWYQVSAKRSSLLAVCWILIPIFLIHPLLGVFASFFVIRHVVTKPFPVINPSEMELPRNRSQQWIFFNLLVRFHESELEMIEKRKSWPRKSTSPHLKEVIIGYFDHSGVSFEPPMDLKARANRCNICYQGLEGQFFRYYECCDIIIHQNHIYSDQDLLLSCPYCKEK